MFIHLHHFCFVSKSRSHECLSSVLDFGATHGTLSKLGAALPAAEMTALKPARAQQSEKASHQNENNSHAIDNGGVADRTLVLVLLFQLMQPSLLLFHAPLLLCSDFAHHVRQMNTHSHQIVVYTQAIVSKTTMNEMTSF